MVFRNRAGVILSVSMLTIGSAAATPVSVVNFCIVRPRTRPAGEVPAAGLESPVAAACQARAGEGNGSLSHANPRRCLAKLQRATVVYWKMARLRAVVCMGSCPNSCPRKPARSAAHSAARKGLQPVRLGSRSRRQRCEEHSPCGLRTLAEGASPDGRLSRKPRPSGRGVVTSTEHRHSGRLSSRNSRRTCLDYARVSPPLFSPLQVHWSSHRQVDLKTKAILQPKQSCGRLVWPTPPAPAQA